MATEAAKTMRKAMNTESARSMKYLLFQCPGCNVSIWRAHILSAAKQAVFHALLGYQNLNCSKNLGRIGSRLHPADSARVPGEKCHHARGRHHRQDDNCKDACYRQIGIPVSPPATTTYAPVRQHSSVNKIFVGVHFRSQLPDRESRETAGFSDFMLKFVPRAPATRIRRKCC
ncbi:MAG: hypothetical protein JWQ00_2081 [Noviherbaspirillum sp.]|nr:hypothetical protein [Noviherbaspirillum sp.]